MLDNIGSNVTSYTYGRLTGPVRSMLKILTRIQRKLNPNINFRPDASIFPFLSVLFEAARAVKYVD